MTTQIIRKQVFCVTDVCVCSWRYTKSFLLEIPVWQVSCAIGILLPKQWTCAILKGFFLRHMGNMGQYFWHVLFLLWHTTAHFGEHVLENFACLLKETQKGVPSLSSKTISASKCQLTPSKKLQIGDFQSAICVKDSTPNPPSSLFFGGFQFAFRRLKCCVGMLYSQGSTPIKGGGTLGCRDSLQFGQIRAESVPRGRHV